MRSATSHRLAATLLLLLTVPLMADVEAMPAGPGRQAATPTAPKTYAPYPEPENGYVTDKAGLLAPEQKDASTRTATPPRRTRALRWSWSSSIPFRIIRRRELVH